MMLHLFESLGQFRILRRIICEQLGPLCEQIAASPSNAITKMLANTIRYEEFRVFRPSIELLDQPDFFFAQRLAMRCVRVLLVRRTVPDVAVNDDQSRPIRGLVEGFKRPRQHLQIVRIRDTGDVPLYPINRVATSSLNDQFAGPSSVIDCGRTSSRDSKV